MHGPPPGDLASYQLNCILIEKGYCKSILAAWSFPGADVDSDRKLVAMKIRMKVKGLITGSKTNHE